MGLLRLCADDPLISALRRLHHANIVRVPSARIEPLLSVAEKGGALSVRGKLKYLLSDPAAPLPDMQVAPSVELSMKQTRAVESKLGLKILAGLLQGFGVPLPPVEAAVSHAAQLSFSFQEVRRRFVDVNALGQTLGTLTVSSKNPAAAIYFGKGAHRLLVIDSVLESKSFGVKVATTKHASAKIDLGKLKPLVEGQVSVGHDGSDESQLVFEGRRHLAFAFTCVELELGPGGKVKSLSPRASDLMLEEGGREPHELLSATPGMLDVAGRPDSDLDWFEAQNVESLREALLRPKRTKERIARAIGQKGLDGLLKPKRMGPAKESPAMTDIIFLHGIMGAHLDGPAGRPWFSLWSMLTSDVAERIRLQLDGTDLEHLRPAGQLNMFYGTARTAWKDRGYEVWPTCYDWRKSLVECADGLHAGIEALAAQPRPDGTPRRLAIVGHSMGGVVAALYASRHAEWSSRIRSAVFMGSPLKGSFAPFEAVTGTYPFFKKLDLLALHSTLAEFQQTSVGLPGLLGLLPDGDFDASLLDATSWPGPAGLVPSQATLDEVRKLQPLISGSPILQRTSLLATLQQPTVASVVLDGTGKRVTGPRDGKGDGTVPAKSCACVAGAPTYEVTAEHSELPNDWDVIMATTRLLEGESPSLRKLSPEDLTGTLAVPEAERGEAADLVMAREAAAMRARLEAGVETADDVRWLLSSEPGKAAAAAVSSPRRKRKR